MNFGFLQRDIDNMTTAFMQYPEIEEVILFGSRARGNYKSGSDVDLAIKGKKVTHSIISAISFILNEEYTLPYYFDVIQYKKITEPKLVEHIDRVGKVIYSVYDSIDREKKSFTRTV